jgi:hypothetical protein
MSYGQLLNSTGRVAEQAKRFSQEIAAGVKRSADVAQQLTLEGMRDKLDEMVPLVRKVMKQTRARILRGDTRGDGKLVSLFEPETEIIRKVFRDGLKCPNALFLDGGRVSSLYAPTLNHPGNIVSLGPMLAVFEANRGAPQQQLASHARGAGDKSGSTP